MSDQMYRQSDIPHDFYSHDTKAPFQQCLVCNCNLASSGAPYFIEKAYRRYPEFKSNDVIYEFAMCFRCAEDMRKSLSQESQTRMNNFIEENNSNNERKSHLANLDPGSTDPWMEKCFITNESIAEQEEYVIYGIFNGDKMMVSDFPYAIGLKAMDALTQLLSNKTLDIMDDFMGKYFTGPPEINELISPRRPVIF